MINLVNTFEVHGPLEEFERAFDAVSEYMRSQPGFCRHTLLRFDGNRSRYVNVAEWEDEQSLRAALRQREFRKRARQLARLATTQPQICRPVLDRFPAGV